MFRNFVPPKIDDFYKGPDLEKDEFIASVSQGLKDIEQDYLLDIEQVKELLDVN